MSADGRYVVFESLDTGLAPGDGGSNGADIFVRDMVGGTTERVSIQPNGQPLSVPSHTPAISADGRYVSFLWGLQLSSGGAQFHLAVRDLVDHVTDYPEIGSPYHR